MDWGALIGPAVVAAGVSGVISVAGVIVSTRTARAIHSEKLAFDRDQAAQKFAFDERLAERKFEFDKELAERKFEFDKLLSAHKLEADTALAEKKFRLDVRMADRKRRQDLAEEVLEAFYKIRDVVRAVRVPMSYQDEAAARKTTEMEPAGVAQQRNSYYAPLARLDANRAEIAALLAKRYRSAAWFGAAAEEPFQDVHEALTKIAFSAQMLIHWVGNIDRQSDQSLFREAEGDIWARALNPDPIATKLDGAISKIEAICRPALEEASV